MAGMVQAVFVKTDLGHLIKIKPHVRIPPTLGKFCAMMCESSVLFYVYYMCSFRLPTLILLVCVPRITLLKDAAQLLQKFSIKARGGGEKLMQLIDNPLVKHLPVNSRIIGNLLICSFHGKCIFLLFI